MRTAAVFISATVVLTGTVFAAAAFTDLLPAPSSGALLATQELRMLARTGTSSASITLDGVRYRTTCRTRGRTTLVTIDDGSKLAIRGVHARSHGVHRPLVGALADLAGSHPLLFRELSDRLRHSPHVLDGTTAVDGRKAYLLRVGNDLSPRVDLVVAAHGLRPLVVRYSSAGISGSSLLATGPSYPVSNHPGC